MARRALMALVMGETHYPGGRLFSDCGGLPLQQLEATASNRIVWHAKVASLTSHCVYYE